MKDTQVKTGKVRGLYIYAFEINPKTENYGVHFVVPKSDKETITAIQNAMKAAVELGKQKFGSSFNPKDLPLREVDPTDEKKANNPNYADCYYMNTKNYNPIPAFDETAKEITVFEKDKLYGGCYIYAALEFVPYLKNGNSGLSVYCQGIQKVADGERVGGGMDLGSLFTVVKN